MFATVYQVTVKRRKTRRVETFWQVYRTKSLTPMHARIRATCPGAKTYEDPRHVFTDLVLGVPLPKPIVQGGREVLQ